MALFVEAPTDDKVTRRPQRAETGRGALGGSDTSGRGVPLVILVLSLTTPVAAGPLEDADAAYSKGDHAAALRLLRPPANQGDAVAQFNLGVMYDNGHGVPQDHVLAQCGSTCQPRRAINLPRDEETAWQRA